MEKRKKFKTLYTCKAEKDLIKLSSIDKDNTLSHIGKLDFPYPTNLDIKKMTNTPNFFRLKFGKVRVLFEIDNPAGTIWIRKIRYRKDIYR